MSSSVFSVKLISSSYVLSGYFHVYLKLAAVPND